MRCAQMPVKNTSEESVLSAKIMGGGQAVKELCGMVLPLGTEGKDDTGGTMRLRRWCGTWGGRAGRRIALLLSKGVV